ncbi:unnamed protein product [Cochlearia groenlandica]
MWVGNLVMDNSRGSLSKIRIWIPPCSEGQLPTYSRFLSSVPTPVGPCRDGLRTRTSLSHELFRRVGPCWARAHH